MWEGSVRTLPVGGMGVGTSEGLGLIAGLVRFAEFDVGGRARLSPRDGPRGQNHVFRPLRSIARGFVRQRQRGAAAPPAAHQHPQYTVPYLESGGLEPHILGTVSRLGQALQLSAAVSFTAVDVEYRTTVSFGFGGYGTFEARDVRDEWSRAEGVAGGR